MSEARDLYTSTLFKLGREYAEKFGDSWVIVSALHGVLQPHDVIDTYQLSREQLELNLQQDEWHRNAVARMYRYRGCRIINLAGKLYSRWTQHMQEDGSPTFPLVETPMDGMLFINRVMFLAQHRKRKGLFDEQ